MTGSPQVQVAQGTVRGVEDGSTEVFRGVPYAEPPVGDLRWRPPRPAPAWSGVRDASVHGAAAPQPPIPTGGPLEVLLGPEGVERTSEDCLTLIVRRPTGTAPGDDLPVLVWLHGGAFVFGHGANPAYAGRALVERGVVLVNVNYRLGALGFLAHPELGAEDEHGVSGHYGALDVVAALQWVHDNVAAFGGDPSRVTLAGESAGASIAAGVAGSPLSAGLVHRVISESAGLFGPPEGAVPRGTGAGDLPLAVAEETGTAFLERLGVTSIDEARTVDPEQLVAAAAAGPDRPPMFFRLVVDGQVLPRPSHDMLTSGAFDHLPVLVGSNADEASLFTPPGTTAEQHRASLAAWGPFADRVGAAYPAADDLAAHGASCDVMGDATFGWPAWTWARTQAGHDGAAVYLYRFEHRPPFPPGPFEQMGAMHAAELPYVFGALDSPAMGWDEDDRALADAMVGAWARFAATGDPNGEGLPTWPPSTADGAEVMRFGDRPEPGELDSDRLHLLDEYFAARRDGSVT